jgi:CSLREA domain-containing protein
MAATLSLLVALATSLAAAPSTKAVTTFVVNRIGDGADLNLANARCDISPNSGNQCTLRAAIQEANDTPGADIINFNITTASKVIAPGSPLPPITDQVTINGYSQANAAANTKAANNNAVLKIVLDGTNAGAGASGLEVLAANSVIRGLVIMRWSDVGIRLVGSENIVAGNFIGTNAVGTAARGNGVGVEIEGADNTVGGTAPAARNLISGNLGHGISITSDLADRNVIQGNFIGTDRAGSADLGNGSHGVSIIDAQSNTIGGDVGGARNVISGNSGHGIRIIDSVDDSRSVVQGNYIGTNAVGTAALGNGGSGIAIDASEMTVGGTSALARNVISGNDDRGVALNNAAFVQISGNYIGTNATGTAAIGNGDYGVLVDESSGISVGTGVPGGGNVISGNGAEGVRITLTARSTVRGNLIGLNAAGTAAIGNGGDGVTMSGVTDTTIGGTTAAARNVISANGESGVSIVSPPSSSDNDVRGNRIGTRADGTGDLGNADHGVRLIGGSNNVVGGDVAGAGNLIAGNDKHGVLLANPMVESVVRGNAIRSNTLAGVAASSVTGAIVRGNAISLNGGDGVQVTATGSRLSVVENQTFANGGLGIDLVGVNDNAAGVTSNDTGDGDSGPNTFQNYPVLTSAVRSTQNGVTTVTGTLNSNPSTAFTIHVYVAAVDPSNHGEGQFLVMTHSVTTDANGDVSFAIFVAGVVQGQQLTATTMRTSTGSTSEFSANLAVQ